MNIIVDAGFSFGEGAFETIKVVNGEPELLGKHLARLNNSLKFLEINKEIREEMVYAYLDGEENQALKIMVSRENTIFITRDDPYVDLDTNIKYRLTISKVLRNSTSPLVYHKTLNYYENILENRKAKQQGYDEVIFLNEKGHICEGSLSNIFFIKDNKIYTPEIRCGLLNGIIREQIIEKFGAIETLIKKEDLDTFDGAFITNSLMKIMPVKSIDEVEFKDSELIQEIIKNLD